MKYITSIVLLVVVLILAWFLIRKTGTIVPVTPDDSAISMSQDEPKYNVNTIYPSNGKD